MILQLVTVLKKALLRQYPTFEEESREIEDAIGDTVDIDPTLFFNLAPESMVSMLQIGNLDPNTAGFVVRAMYYEAEGLEQHGYKERAALRRAQADAIVKAYCPEITLEDLTPGAIREYFAQDDADPSSS
jgi:hypothetical protein